MEILYNNDVSVKKNKSYKINDSFSNMSEDIYNKEDKLLKYIFVENRIDLSEIYKIQNNYNRSINIYNIDNNTTLKNSIFICNEEFFMEEESDMIIIEHSKWSLVGQGQNLYEAIKNMKEFAFEIYKSMADDKPSELTIEANNLRDFLFKLF